MMAAAVLRKTQGLHLSYLQRWYSALAVPLTSPIETASPDEGARRLPEEVKVSKVNGFMVASVENYSIMSNVSVFLRAGSRYETYNQQGLTHLLRKCAFLGNDDRSALRNSRETEQIGASLDATTTREHLVYSSSFLRGNLTSIMDTLGSVICRPQFKPWEVADTHYLLPLELAQAEAAPFSTALEGLHQVAYRNALCNPLYCPTRNASKFTNEDLQAYVEKYFNPENTVVVGIGVNHEELEGCVQNSFKAEAVMDSAVIQADYVGGAELHLPSNSSFTCSVVACKGTSLKGGHADLVTAGVLQHLLGADPESRLKWGSNTTSRLSRAGSMATDLPFSASALNINYTDSGLFGIIMLSDPNDSAKLLRATMKEFSAVAGGDISEEDITRAKNQLKSRYLMGTETVSSLSEDIAYQVGLKGTVTPISETLALVDKVTKDDVVKFSRAVFSTKASYVAHGNLSNAPRLDQLLAEVSLK